MMNALVRRYTVGRPVQERVALAALWKGLEEQHKSVLEKRLYGPLPSFGRTALAFIREMREMGFSPAKAGTFSGRRVPYSPPTQTTGMRT